MQSPPEGSESVFTHAAAQAIAHYNHQLHLLGHDDQQVDPASLPPALQQLVGWCSMPAGNLVLIAVLGRTKAAPIVLETFPPVRPHRLGRN